MTPVPLAGVEVELVERHAAAGIGDTIGVATSAAALAPLCRLKDAGVPADGVGVHFDDTYGQAHAKRAAVGPA